MNSSAEQLIEVVEKILFNEEYDYIYLATEDSINYRKFKNRFKNRLLYTNQERYDLEKNKKYELSLLYEYPRIKDGFENGLDYLLVIYTLSQCESLISSMPCGAFVAAKVMNDNKYKKVILTNQ